MVGMCRDTKPGYMRGTPTIDPTGRVGWKEKADGRKGSNG